MTSGDCTQKSISKKKHNLVIFCIALTAKLCYDYVQMGSSYPTTDWPSITFRPVCCRALCTFLSQHFALLSKASSPKQLLYSEFWHFALSKRRTARRATVAPSSGGTAVHAGRSNQEFSLQSVKKGTWHKTHFFLERVISQLRKEGHWNICILQIIGAFCIYPIWNCWLVR